MIKYLMSILLKIFQNLLISHKRVDYRQLTKKGENRALSQRKKFTVIETTLG